MGNRHVAKSAMGWRGGPRLRSFAPRSPLLTSGTVLLGLIAVAVSVGSLVFSVDAFEFRTTTALAPPSAEHWFGTDRFGRDMFARVLEGGRVSVGTASAAMVAILVIGVTLGSIAGYAGRWVDGVIMRVVDVLIALPSFIVALVAAGLFGASLKVVLIAIIGLWWVSYARITRGVVLQAKEQPHVVAARAAGASPMTILVREVLPQVVGPVVVVATIDVGHVILAIAGLSFLGVGAQPPTPEWGTMLSEGREYFLSAPHLMVFPGLAIFLTVLATNLLGEGLQERLDPHSLAGRG